jgi:hypothetical protein
MSAHQLNAKIEAIDTAMKLLRIAMKTPVIRTAGFKSDHDKVARSVATATNTAEAARPLFNTGKGQPKARRR